MGPRLVSGPIEPFALIAIRDVNDRSHIAISYALKLDLRSGGISKGRKGKYILKIGGNIETAPFNVHASLCPRFIRCAATLSKFGRVQRH